MTVVLLGFAIKKRIAHCVNLLLAGCAVDRPALRHSSLLIFPAQQAFLPPLPPSLSPSLSLSPFSISALLSFGCHPLPLLFIHSAATTPLRLGVGTGSGKSRGRSATDTKTDNQSGFGEGGPLHHPFSFRVRQTE